MPEGAAVVFSAHGVAPSVHESGAGAQPRGRRRHLPARDEGAQRGQPLRAGAATRSCSSATRATRRSWARWARRPTRSCSSSPRRRSTRSTSRPTRRSPTSRRRRSRWTRPASSSTALRERFPWIEAPVKDDICYATSNRQAAVKALAREVDLVLVIGSRNSSNSTRRFELDELRDPITSTRSTSRTRAFTAAWRFWVA